METARVIVRIVVTSGELDPEVRLYDPNGLLLCEASSFGAFTEISECALPETATYAIRADDRGGTNSGDYNLHLQRVNDPAGTTLLTIDQSVGGSIDIAPETDAYTFSAGAECITICLATEAGSISPSMDLYDTAGNLLASGSSQIQHCFESSGTFHLFVSDSIGSRVGIYKLHLGSGTFSCSSIDLEDPEVIVLAPNGGEIIESTSNFQIEWTATDNVGVTSQEIRLSTDGGETFPLVVAADLAGDVEIFDWLVPEGLSAVQARVQVLAQDDSGNTGLDESDNNFVVVDLSSSEIRQISYTYDKLNRLVEAEYDTGVTISYTYDAVGNILSRTVSVSQVGLFFPFYQAEGSTFTGFAVSNFSESPAALEFTSFEESGSESPFPVNPANFELASGEQLARLLARLGEEIFSVDQNTPQAGWVQLTSDNPEIGSFFQFGGPARLDGSVAFEQKSRRFYFTRVFEGPTAFRGQPATTFLSIANPNDHGINLKLSLFDSTEEASPAEEASLVEENHAIPAKGFLLKSVSEIFGQDLLILSGYIEVEVTKGAGAVGFELIQLDTRATVIGLNAFLGNSANESFSAQLANGQFAPGVNLYTDLKLVNISPETRLVTLRAIAEDGSNLSAPVEVSLAPGEALERDIGEIFGLGANSSPILSVGSIRIEADGPGVIGDVIFGDAGTFSNAASMPLQTRKFTRAVFSQVASGLGLFTGLAVYNPGTDAAEVTIRVFSEQGEQTGETVLVVEAGERFSRALSELIPSVSGQIRGYIVIRSTRPLVAQQLVGDTGLTLLSAVPPTIIE